MTKEDEKYAPYLASLGAAYMCLVGVAANETRGLLSTLFLILFTGLLFISLNIMSGLVFFLYLSIFIFIIGLAVCLWTSYISFNNRKNFIDDMIKSENNIEAVSKVFLPKENQSAKDIEDGIKIMQHNLAILSKAKYYAVKDD